MASPDLLDFEALTTPITEDQPGGGDVRETHTTLYYELKDARNAARIAERQALQSGEDNPSTPSEWRTVAKTAPKVLKEHTKDLEVVAWLTEALLRVHGFAGIRDGLRLAREFCEQFGEHLYPRPDEDGEETRLAPLTGLNGMDAEGTLIAPISLVAITEDIEHGAFNIWRYNKARDNSRGEGGSDGPTLDQFESTLLRTNVDFVRDVLDDLESAIEECNRMSDAFTAKFGSDAPPTTSIRNALTEALETARHVTKTIPGLEPEVAAEPDPETSDAETDGSNASPAAAPAQPGEIRTRDDAFRALRKVAEFFRATEPHSPIASAIDQAVRWGQLPLHKLVEELIPDDDARSRFNLVTGLRNELDDE